MQFNKSEVENMYNMENVDGIQKIASSKYKTKTNIHLPILIIPICPKSSKIKTISGLTQITNKNNIFEKEEKEWHEFFKRMEEQKQKNNEVCKIEESYENRANKYYHQDVIDKSIYDVVPLRLRNDDVTRLTIKSLRLRGYKLNAVSKETDPKKSEV